MENKSKLTVFGILAAIIAVAVFVLYNALNKIAYGTKEDTAVKPAQVMTYTTSVSIFMAGEIDDNTYDYSSVSDMVTNYELSFVDGEYNVKELTGEVEGVTYQLLKIDDDPQAYQNISTDGYDMTIVAIDWKDAGSEVSEHQKEVAKALAEKEVSVVIGMGDEIAPMDWIDDTAVFYSLGKCAGANENIGMIASIRLTKSIAGDWIETELSQAKADLIYTDENNTLITFSKLLDSDPSFKEVYDQYCERIGSLTNEIRFGGLE